MMNKNPKVTLRKKKIKGGKSSLYLDIYPSIPNPVTGKPTRRHFLNIHILNNPRTDLERTEVNANLRKAEILKQQKQNEVDKPEIYSDNEKEKIERKEKMEMNFVEFFSQQVDKRSGQNFNVWTSAYNHLNVYCNGFWRMGDLSEARINAYKSHLLKATSLTSDIRRISKSTASAYFNKFKAALREAYHDRILDYNINDKIRSIPSSHGKREWLEPEELNALANTPCIDKNLFRYALFSALSGLRIGDLRKLTWDNIKHNTRGYYIDFQMEKTESYEYHTVSDQAVELLGERKGKNELIFLNIPTTGTINKRLREWIEEAGIDKKLSFHCLRHTYASILLNNDVEPWVVQNLLGHKNLSTTMIYAKISDSTKNAAKDMIKIDFDSFPSIKDEE